MKTAYIMAATAIILGCAFAATFAIGWAIAPQAPAPWTPPPVLTVTFRDC